MVGPEPSLQPAHSGVFCSISGWVMLQWQTWELGCRGELEPAFGSPTLGLPLAERQVAGRGVSFPRGPAGCLGI